MCSNVSTGYCTKMTLIKFYFVCANIGITERSMDILCNKYI